jgi:hypothetical protein
MSVRVEVFLQLRETLDVGSEKCLGFVLIDIDSPGVGRIKGREPKTLGIIDAKVLDQFRDIHTAYSKGYSKGYLPISLLCSLFSVICRPT